MRSKATGNELGVLTDAIRSARRSAEPPKQTVDAVPESLEAALTAIQRLTQERDAAHERIAVLTEFILSQYQNACKRRESDRYTVDRVEQLFPWRTE